MVLTSIRAGGAGGASRSSGRACWRWSHPAGRRAKRPSALPGLLESAGEWRTCGGTGCGLRNSRPWAPQCVTAAARRRAAGGRYRGSMDVRTHPGLVCVRARRVRPNGQARHGRATGRASARAGELGAAALDSGGGGDEVQRVCQAAWALGAAPWVGESHAGCAAGRVVCAYLDELEPEAYGEGDGGQVKRRGQEGAALGHDTGEGRGGSDSLPPARSAPART